MLAILLINIVLLATLIKSDTFCDGEVCQENEDKSFYISEASDFDDSPVPTEFRMIEKPDHVVDENKQIFVTFINSCDQQITVFWLNGESERANGQIQANGGSIQIGTYIGHKFFYRLNSELNSSERLQITAMKRGVNIIYFKDPEIKRQELIEFSKEKQKFKDEYFNKTGIRWISYYPRDPPSLHMFSAEYVGQRHIVTSHHPFYHCYPKTNKSEDVMACRNNNELTFEWKIESTSPKVMWLDSPFLSDFEINHIIQIATPLLNRSTTGQDENIQVSYSRTSSGAWIQRHCSEVIDWIFKRIGDVTKIAETHLWPSYGCEQLQVLKYDVGQQFFPHPDYNTDKKGMRFLTFLMYLNDENDGLEGGETEFPKANFKVKPKKGHVAAFYSVLKDGNADSRSLHAGLPVSKGIKWAATLWIWDPYFER